MAMEILTSTVTLGRGDDGETRIDAVIELRGQEGTSYEGAQLTIRLLDAAGAQLSSVGQALLPFSDAGPHSLEATGFARLGDAVVATAECEIHGGAVERQSFTPDLEGGGAGASRPAADPSPQPADAWSQLAAGTATTAPEGLQRARLLSRARKTAISPEVAERLEGARVAIAIGGRDGLEVVGNLLKDPDPEVRRAAFDAGVAAREEGLILVRAAAGAPDPAIATEALGHLATMHDRTATTRARTLLRHDSAQVRAAAVRLLGITSGRTLRPSLTSLLDDPSGEVRVAAANAVATLDGERPRPRKRGWWEPAPEGEEAALDASRPAALPDRPATPTAARSTVDLADLLTRLGAASDDQRPEILSRLGDLAPEDVGAQVRLVGTSSPEAVARGAAMAVGALGLDRLVSHIRRLLRHDAAAVRSAAVEAVGTCATSGVLPSMATLLKDDSVEVRVSAVVALATAGASTGRVALVSGWLDAITDEDPAMVAALERAREILPE